MLEGNFKPCTPWKEHNIYVDSITKTLGDKYGLIPVKRPVISPPPKKENTLDIAGSFGITDLSTILTGYPIYSNRTGSLGDFMLLYPEYASTIEENRTIINRNIRTDPQISRYVWLDRYNALVNDLNGKPHKIMLADGMYEDDEIGKETWWYYYGYLTVKNFTPGDKYSTVSIDYNLDPFRYSYLKRSELTYLDDDEKAKFQPIEVNNNSMTELFTINPVYSMHGNYFRHDILLSRPELYPTFVELQPVYPTITVWTEDSNGIEIGFINDKLNMNRSEIYGPGVHEAYRFTITPNSACTFYAKGTGAVQIDWRDRAL